MDSAPKHDGNSSKYRQNRSTNDKDRAKIMMAPGIIDIIIYHLENHRKYGDTALMTHKEAWGKVVWAYLSVFERI